MTYTLNHFSFVYSSFGTSNFLHLFKMTAISKGKLTDSFSVDAAC